MKTGIPKDIFEAWHAQITQLPTKEYRKGINRGCVFLLLQCVSCFFYTQTHCHAVCRPLYLSSYATFCINLLDRGPNTGAPTRSAPNEVVVVDLVAVNEKSWVTRVRFPLTDCTFCFLQSSALQQHSLCDSSRASGPAQSFLSRQRQSTQARRALHPRLQPR